MYVTRIAYFLVLVTLTLSQTLTGDYVCHREENYTVETVETYTVPLEVYTMEWCFEFPPRCPQKKLKLRQESRVKTELKTRVVDECCEGYTVREVDTTKTYCIPKCDKCKHGSCSDPGYLGSDCSYECRHETWGKYCIKKCDCTLYSGCNSSTGSCECLPGWQGSRCDEKCPKGKWGTNCAFTCSCRNSISDCDPITGICHDFTEESKKNWTIEEFFNVSSVAVVDLPLTSTAMNVHTENSTKEQTKDKKLPKSTEKDSAISNIDEFSSTAKTDITPENNDKIITKEALIPRVIFSPESDFVKNLRKDEPSSPAPIPTDVAVLIVIGSMISLSLTSVAALMIFHMRSRLIKAIRMSIYPNDKSDNQHPDVNSVNVVPKSVQHANTLPKAAPRMHSIVLTSSDEPKTVLTLEDATNQYANQTVTIDFRNLRDLLEGHYDRPTSSYRRNDDQTEHVYDEIPLATSFRVNKNT